jgi:hypothetical protein
MKPKVSKPKMYDGPAWYMAMSGRWVVLDHFGQKVGEVDTEVDARKLFNKLEFKKST